MTTPIQSLINLPEQPEGIVFWWSNILRAYQLRVYLPDGSTPSPIHLPQIYLTQAEIETAAQALANQYHLPIYQINIERIHNTLLDQ